MSTPFCAASPPSMSPSSNHSTPPLMEMLSPYLAQVFFLNTMNQMIQSILPLLTSLFNFFTRGRDYLKSYIYYDVTESEAYESDDEFFEDVKLYLSDIAVRSPTTTRFNLTRPKNSSVFNYGLSPNNRITDTFNGILLSWDYTLTNSDNVNQVKREKGKFSLCLCRKEKELVVPAYLEQIKNVADDIRSRSRERLLYSNTYGSWESTSFKHPSTFDTLAMNPVKKDEIIRDLRDFADNGRTFYRRTGRAWKRGYLLYGPPGTGKSSMIAAMANYLLYDIYDVELTRVSTNSDLRNLLTRTTSKSIIVIEDIDCSVNLSKRGKKSSEVDGGGNSSITLSGLLNCTDGLWSCCETERIFLFTTNHIENIDPALLRAGRMDMHIHMGYCSFEALKILMNNYLGFEDSDYKLYDCNDLMGEVKAVIDEAEISPADVSEMLIQKRRLNMPEAIQKLLNELKDRTKQRREREKLRKELKDRAKQRREDRAKQRREREDEDGSSLATDTSEDTTDTSEDTDVDEGANNEDGK